MTANDITAHLLLEIPRRFRARAWRRNVGRGVGYDAIRQAIALINSGRASEAPRVLTSRPVSFGLPGEPDIEGIIDVVGVGCFLGVEVKAGRDKMREEQESFQAMALRFGAIYVVAHDVERAIEEIESCRRELEKRARSTNS